MRKRILIVVLIVLCIVGWYRSNYIFVENDFKEVFYPKSGMVQTEQDAINLCCLYFQSVYGLEVPKDSLYAQYYKHIDAWYVKSIAEKNDSQILDGELCFLIRKRDGKILMHSIY